MKNFFKLLICFLILLSCGREDKSDNDNNDQLMIITDPFGPDDFVGDHKAKVAILGVFHFANPGLDEYKQEFAFDILDKDRQDELDDVLVALQKYQPTKILVEDPRIKRDSILNIEYQNYLEDRFDISLLRSETYQIGFKLAKQLGHAKIYASDTEKLKWCGTELDWNQYDEDAYLQAQGNFDKARRYQYIKKYRFQDSLKSVVPLINFLSFKNTLSNRLKDHQAYLTEVSLVGAGDLYVGADAVARWYQRNIRIFANTYDVTSFSKEDRILLIYGSGHVWTLKQMFQDSPDFDYVEINNYLVDK